jgi:hypothetical protein
MTKQTVISGFLVTLLMGGVSSADAQTQTATSFEQLRILVQPGDTVSVTDRTGTRTSGKVHGLSEASLEVDLGSERRIFVESEVTTIQQRRGDSLANGALWGLAAGAAYATAGMIMIGVDCYGDANCAAVGAGTIGVYGAIGAGIGVGIDALIKDRRVVYRSPTANTRLNVAPLLTARSKGVLLSIGL